ncbi:MAG: glycoside hydrolase family 25 protein [Lachnospiraceae bacterium]|nr:glycoside hydrolase family 25 protein [Lachnospiraceae bacterium]
MEPGMGIREEHKRDFPEVTEPTVFSSSNTQQEEHLRALRSHRRRTARPRRRKSGLALGVLFVTILIAAVLFTILVMRLREEKAARQRAEEALKTISEIEAARGAGTGNAQTQAYTQVELDMLVAEAKEDAAAETERALREDLKERLEGQGLTSAIRSFYPEYMFYQIPGGYRFTLIDENRPKNGITKESLQREEHGWLQFVTGEEVKSAPMVDVSQFQGEIDWQAVAEAGVKHAMLRVGYRGYGSGKLLVDECFAQNIQGAAENGVAVGVYFFTQAISVEEAHEEAALVIEQLAPYEVQLPVAIDVERITNDTARADALDKATRTGIVHAFLEDIREAGYTPMIYGGVYSFFEMLEMSEIQQYETWYAYYDDELYYPYEIRAWQYTEKATVPGISGKVDMNLLIP